MQRPEHLLRKLISLRSYVPYESGTHEFLTEFLEDRGFIVSRQHVEKERYNLIAYKGKARKSVLIYMHNDTVPPVEKWQTKPLTLTDSGDTYTGLGCFDMKGGTAAFLSILDQLEELPYTLKLVFGVDEEGMSKGVYKLVNSAFVKDVVFALCPEACIVPDDWKLPVTAVIGGRGRCVIRVTMPGKTSHGAEDKGGINAISELAICITCLKKWKGKTHSHLGKSSWFVRNISGGNDELSIPHEANFEIDYQLVPGETPDSVRSSLEAFITTLYQKELLDQSVQRGLRIELVERPTPYIAPYALSQKSAFVELASGILVDMFGMAEFDHTKSVADQNVLVNVGIPTLTVGPLGGNAHQADEWVSKESLEDVANFYKALLPLLAPLVESSHIGVKHL